MSLFNRSFFRQISESLDLAVVVIVSGSHSYLVRNFVQTQASGSGRRDPSEECRRSRWRRIVEEKIGSNREVGLTDVRKLNFTLRVGKVFYKRIKRKM